MTTVQTHLVTYPTPAGSAGHVGTNPSYGIGRGAVSLASSYSYSSGMYT